MEKLGKTLFILAAIVGLIVLGGIAGRILLFLAMLAVRLSLGICVVLAIWAIFALIKAARNRHYI